MSLMEKEILSDILLVEDVRETVEGLELDLESRGGAVFNSKSANKARSALAMDPYHLVLFDLRIPEVYGQEPRLDVGLNLIREMIGGVLGDINAGTLFGIVSMQAVVSEVDEFRQCDHFIGSFSKNEDSRRLFRVLVKHGLLQGHEFDDEVRPEVRRRVKFLIKSVTRPGVALGCLPSWGDTDFEIPLRELRPSARRAVLEGGLPVFVYGTANVAAVAADGLKPQDLDEVVPLRPLRSFSEL